MTTVIRTAYYIAAIVFALTAFAAALKWFGFSPEGEFPANYTFATSVLSAMYMLRTGRDW